MDLRKYCAMKSAGTVRILNVSGRFFLEKRNFCPDTGAEILGSDGKPELLPIDKASLIAQRDALEDDLETIDCFLTDVELTEEAGT
jgi:hypothetical protein